VREGPYSLCRNPLYVGSFLIACSVALFLQSPIFAAGVVASVYLYVRGTVPAEEEHLRAALGEEYRTYCETVPRFVPRFSGFRAESPIVVHLNGLRRELLRALQWVMVPVVGEVLLGLRVQPWWPHLWAACSAGTLRCWIR
jgi:hypothetical protein